MPSLGAATSGLATPPSTFHLRCATTGAVKGAVLYVARTRNCLDEYDLPTAAPVSDGTWAGQDELLGAAILCIPNNLPLINAEMP